MSLWVELLPLRTRSSSVRLESRNLVCALICKRRVHGTLLVERALSAWYIPFSVVVSCFWSDGQICKPKLRSLLNSGILRNAWQ